MLKIEKLTKCFGDKRAVDDLSLHIARGEIFGFIGHNGAGKTTTLKCIAGILPIETGDVKVAGLSMRDDPLACKRIMDYIPDDPQLSSYMRGRQYLDFIADIYHLSKRERDERIDRYAEAFGLKDDLSEYIATYSHGMKQKLAIIGAWIHEPQLILMDEPFVGLDPKAAHTLKQMMAEFCGRGGAIFFSTHVLETAEKLCDKVAILKEGKLLVAGPIEEVKGDESLEDVFLELV